MKDNIFAERRKAFMEQMNGGVAIFTAAPPRLRNHDVEYEYRQDSNFYYLTGFEEPEAICVLAPDNNQACYTLFVQPRDRAREAWTGIRAGVDGAILTYNADKAHTIDEADKVLPDLLANAPKLYYSIGRYPEWDAKVFGVLKELRGKYRLGIHPPPVLIDSSDILWEMRLIKSEHDLELMQRAVDISVQGHTAAMESAAPGRHEYEIQAVLEYHFRRAGSPRNAYPSIVGSGPFGCILHYTSNNRQVPAGDLVLIDAAAEYRYFAADITRTFPVSGKFTPEQKAVYEVVLNAQKQAIESARPGNTIMGVHDIAVRALTEGMISLGLLTGTIDENIENKKFEKYYMHRTSHWLGMDVHDVGKYKQGDEWKRLEEGMVLTVEPGIYITEDDEHARFQNIGIRIEDDVLITRDGCKVLSAACPKEVGDLEGIIGRKAADF